MIQNRMKNGQLSNQYINISLLQVVLKMPPVYFYNVYRQLTLFIHYKLSSPLKRLLLFCLYTLFTHQSWHCIVVLSH